jgi:hypothetical protein
MFYFQECLYILEFINTKQKPDTGEPAAHASARYRCFLPDLAGLAGIRRAGPMPDASNFTR